MARRAASRRSARGQGGAALIVFATVLILGVAWFTVGALGNAAPTTASREIRTGEALQAGKKALLAYVAQYAARFDTLEPGQLPCPESMTLANVGEASSSCSATLVNVGRLPWKTLGIDQLRDGEGEPLWYVMRGFRSAPINFSSTGLLNHNASTVVAMILAPGRPRNTASLAGTLANCTKQDQLVANRNSATLNAANFLECGVAGSITSPGDPAWTNDRLIAITQAEWVDAIAGPVADRLQRQVAPLIRSWDDIELTATGRSWGATHGQAYLPFASDWEDPSSASADLYCGNQDTLRGLMPIDPACYNSDWTVQNVNTGGLLDIWGGGNGCTDAGTFLRCRFVRILGLGSANAQIVLSASNVARAFRSTLRQQDLTPSNLGSATLSMSLSNATSEATMTVNLTWPGNLLLLSLGQVVSVDIPHLQDAQILSDARFAWYWNNQWHRYTYYGVSPDATANNSNWWDACDAAGDPGCLTVNGLPAASGDTNDKRLVLVLSGKPLAGQSQPSASLSAYFENQNASPGVIYEMGTAGTAFNDQVASCPFKYLNHSGANVVICN